MIVLTRPLIKSFFLEDTFIGFALHSTMLFPSNQNLNASYVQSNLCFIYMNSRHCIYSSHHLQVYGLDGLGNKIKDSRYHECCFVCWFGISLNRKKDYTGHVYMSHNIPVLSKQHFITGDSHTRKSMYIHDQMSEYLLLKATSNISELSLMFCTSLSSKIAMNFLDSMWMA